MNEYSDECLDIFLKNQGQLFNENVAENPELFAHMVAA